MVTYHRIREPQWICTSLSIALMVVSATLLLTWMPTSSIADQPAFQGRRLTEVLEEFRRKGVSVVYSTAVVSPDMRVVTEPTASSFRAQLRQMLQPLGLRVSRGPGDAWLVLPDSQDAETAKPGEDFDYEYVSEIVVTPGRHSILHEESTSSLSVSSEHIGSLPGSREGVGGAARLLPGVSSYENTAAVSVRGSLMEDVAVVLDGLELNDPYHLRSLHSPFSLIDSSIVRNIDLYSGGFTAEFGDRHGAFIDVSTISPLADRARRDLEIGSMFSRMSLSSLHRGGQGSTLVSGRFWYPEALLASSELDDEGFDPRFGDLYMKSIFHPGTRHRLSIHALTSYDHLEYVEGDEQVPERLTTTTRSGHLWMRSLSTLTQRSLSETVLSAGLIDSNRAGFSAEETPIDVDDQRTIQFVGLKHQTTWDLSETRLLKAGGRLRWQEARYRYANRNLEDSSSSRFFSVDPHGLSLELHGSLRMRLRPRLAVELGARWNRPYYVDDDRFSPRLNAVWRADEGTEVRLALGRFSQSQRISELRVGDGETTFHQPELSDQAELSLQHTFDSERLVRLNGFYRRLSELRPRYENLFEPFELFPETSQDRVRIAPDEARIRGIELFARSRPELPLFWWMSYSYAVAEDLFDGKRVPRSLDQRHAASVVVGYRREGQWSLSMAATARSGWPLTSVSAVEGQDDDGSIEYEIVPVARNQDRYPMYARLDVEARRAIPLPSGRVWLAFEILNVTDRQNAWGIDEFDVQASDSGSLNVSPRYDYWRGITPILSLVFQF